MAAIEMRMHIRRKTEGTTKKGDPFVSLQGPVDGVEGTWASWFAPVEASGFREGDVLNLTGSIRTSVSSYEKDGESKSGVNLDLQVESITSVVRGGVSGLSEALASVTTGEVADSSDDFED